MNSIISHVSMERTGRSLETSSFWDYGHLTIAANHRRGKGNRQCARRNVKRIARNGCDRAASSTMELRQKVGPVEPVGAETALYTNEDKAFYAKRMWAEGLTPTAASRLRGVPPHRRTLAAWDADPIAATHSRPVQYSQNHAYGQEAPTRLPYSFLAEGPRASRALSASRASSSPNSTGSSPAWPPPCRGRPSGRRGHTRRATTGRGQPTRRM